MSLKWTWKGGLYEQLHFICPVLRRKMRLPFITNYLLYRGALSGKFDSTIEKRGSNGILGTNNYAWLSLEMFADFNRCDRQPVGQLHCV